MKIAVLGDLHGGVTAARNAIHYAKERQATHLLQVGDLGYYPPQEVSYSYDLEGECQQKKAWLPYSCGFIQEVEQVLEEVALPLWWCKGNHDNPEALSLLAQDEQGHCPLTKHISYLPQGYRWQWEDHEWLALGGAVTLTRDQLLEGVDYFPQEVLTEGEVEAVLSGGAAEVLLCHEAPEQGPTVAALCARSEAAPGEWDPIAWEEARGQRELLGRVVRELPITTVVHGHHHLAYRDDFLLEGLPRTILGLGRDGQPLEKLVTFLTAEGKPTPA